MRALLCSARPSPVAMDMNMGIDRNEHVIVVVLMIGNPLPVMR